MQAVYIEEHGGPEVLSFGEQPDPKIKSDEVLIRVRASALNRLDLYTREGGRGLRREFPPPLILGGDCSGEIMEVGGQVAHLKAADRVVVNPRLTCQQCQACFSGHDDLCPVPRFMGSAIDGSYAELAAVPAANVHVIEDGVSFEQAAAMPTTFLPIWNMLMRKTLLQPWETVLVQSASAGVGTAAIQIAKRVIGARVIATTSTAEKAKKAKDLGADEVINYNDEDVTERVKELTGGAGVDVVVDHVGGDFYGKLFSALRPGGRYGTCGATGGLRTELHLGLLFSRQIQITGVFMGTKQDMQQLVAMLNRGSIDPVVDRTFPLSQAAAAHRAMEETNFFGKLLLVP